MAGSWGLASALESCDVGETAAGVETTRFLGGTLLGSGGLALLTAPLGTGGAPSEARLALAASLRWNQLMMGLLPRRDNFFWSAGLVVVCLAKCPAPLSWALFVLSFTDSAVRGEESGSLVNLDGSETFLEVADSLGIFEGVRDMFEEDSKGDSRELYAAGVVVGKEL